MSDYSSYTERDAFNEALCNLVEEYLQEKMPALLIPYLLSKKKLWKLN
jgi:hypothetical protein